MGMQYSSTAGSMSHHPHLGCEHPLGHHEAVHCLKLHVHVRGQAADDKLLDLQGKRRSSTEHRWLGQYGCQDDLLKPQTSSANPPKTQALKNVQSPGLTSSVDCVLDILCSTDTKHSTTRRHAGTPLVVAPCCTYPVPPRTTHPQRPTHLLLAQHGLLLHALCFTDPRPSPTTTRRQTPPVSTAPTWQLSQTSTRPSCATPISRGSNATDSTTSSPGARSK
jgi:hypothetical protein